MAVLDKKIIEVKKITKVFDGNKPAVKEVSFSINKGEFVTLLGPSGCGKTTLLRMLAGFETPSEGSIYFGGEDITSIPPHKRPINTVFQRYALFPHLNVYNNIAFGLKLKEVAIGEFITKKNGEKYEKMRKYTKQEIKDKVDYVLKLVDLEDYGHRNVDSLSGGQMQRVAIARAIVNEPEVLLLDEPLGALDLKMRKDMQIELMNMHKKLGITFVYVTHDQEEALTMSDTIVVMRDGVIQQIGDAKKIYDEPANAFVADFIGESNIFSGCMLQDRKVEFCEHIFECVDAGFKKNELIDVIVRPEDISILKNNGEFDMAQSMVTAKVTSCVFKGDHYQTIALISGKEEENEILIHDNIECNIDEIIGLVIKPNEIHIMHKSRIINELVTEMWDTNVVEICGGKFPCECDKPSGTKVKVQVDFDDVEIVDDEDDGIISATVVSSIYKGSYYQCVIRADDYYDFFVDTEDDWLKGDRVGVKIAKEKILISVIEGSEANE